LLFTSEWYLGAVVFFLGTIPASFAGWTLVPEEGVLLELYVQQQVLTVHHTVLLLFIIFIYSNDNPHQSTQGTYALSRFEPSPKKVKKKK